MPVFLYRCPNTGLSVQGFVADDPPSDDDTETYETVTCHACGRAHLVNPKNSDVAGSA